MNEGAMIGAQLNRVGGDCAPGESDCDGRCELCLRLMPAAALSVVEPTPSLAKVRTDHLAHAHLPLLLRYRHGVLKCTDPLEKECCGLFVHMYLRSSGVKNPTRSGNPGESLSSIYSLRLAMTSSHPKAARLRTTQPCM